MEKKLQSFGSQMILKKRSAEYSYSELFELTCQFSNALEVTRNPKGDRVIIYMPMIPEAAIAMLACAV